MKSNNEKQEQSIKNAKEGLYASIKRNKHDFAGKYLTFENPLDKLADHGDAHMSTIPALFEASFPGKFAQALTPGCGMSVSAAGADNDTLQKSWQQISRGTSRDPDGREVVTILYRNGIELEFSLTYTHYAKHNAILIGGELRNAGKAPVKGVTELRSFELAFDVDVIGDPALHTIGGGITHFIFPPLAFQTDERHFTGSLYSSFRIDAGETGRSSDKHMPFFHVEDGDGASGIYGGLEWSSMWKIDFQRRNEYFYIRGGMDDVNLTLKPGDHVPIPRALLGFYEGDIHAGRNRLRRFIRDWFPRHQGEDLGAPVTWNHAFTFEATINDEIFRRQVPVCAELGFEWMQIDWGWYAGCIQPNGMFNGIGNWNTVDQERFPNGIEPLAELVRSHGMKYCTWMDPEEAHPSSELAREHPKWMLYIDDKVMGLVNFGLREVQDYFIEMISRKIAEWGIYKLKWDNNINPLPYWQAHEAPANRGVMQIAHIRGVYRVWEELCSRNPGLVLENCSSGGRRLDLGTFARAHIHHGSDFNFNDDIIRTQISGANTVMPTYRVIHTCTWGGPDSPDTYFMSRFGGILRFSQDFANWPEEGRRRAAKHIAVYKSVRHLLRGDFYALLPQPRTRDWDAWQFHDPDSGEGFVMAFRMRGESARALRLKGVEPDKRYRVTDPYAEEGAGEAGEIVSGSELLQQGLPFELPQDSAALRHYKEVLPS